MKKLLLLFLLGLSLLCTWLAYPINQNNLIKEGDFYLVKADFHVHSFFGDGGSSPLAVVYQAYKKGINCFALTNHNQLLTAQIANWWTSVINGPIVFVGSEITSPNYHIIGVGLNQKVDWRQSAAEIIEAVHQQGGIAIAAHPTTLFASHYPSEALAKLDGSEVYHSLYYDRPDLFPQLPDFYKKNKAQFPNITPIASSDWHVFDGLGHYKTIIVSKDLSKSSLLEAIRQKNTIVRTPDGIYYGKPELIEVVKPRAKALFKINRPSKIVHILSGLFLIGSLLLFGQNYFFRNIVCRKIK